MIHRRRPTDYGRLIVLAIQAAFASLALPVVAQTPAVRAPFSTTFVFPPEPPSLSRDDFLGIATYSIWPDQARSGVTLSMLAPVAEKRNGAAVIIAPGGGYIALSGASEGRQVADWFAARGITAFILRYRLGGDAPLPLPIEDGEQAVRYVRSHASALGLDADRIGMIGFSAGGHLTAMTVAGSDPGDPASGNPVGRVSSRPDFMILAYPSLTTTRVNGQGGSRYCRFAEYAGWSCNASDYAAVTPFPDVFAKAAPTFIYQTTDDAVVPVGDSLELYEGLVAAGVDAEMHLFAHGSHGSSLGDGDPALSLWPQALDAWLRARGYISPARPAVAP